MRRRLIVLLIALFSIGGFATLFAIIFPQVPKKQSVLIRNALQAETAVSEGERLTIGLRGPEPSTVIVSEVHDTNFTTSDGRTISYGDLFDIIMGTPPSKHGYDWAFWYPTGPQKVLSPGQTVTVDFKGPEPFVATIARKDADSLSTDDGAVIPYREVLSISRNVPLWKRIGTTIITMPLFLLWAFVDFASVFGAH